MDHVSSGRGSRPPPCSAPPLSGSHRASFVDAFWSESAEPLGPRHGVWWPVTGRGHVVLRRSRFWPSLDGGLIGVLRHPTVVSVSCVGRWSVGRTAMRGEAPGIPALRAHYRCSSEADTLARAGLDGSASSRGLRCATAWLHVKPRNRLPGNAGIASGAVKPL